MATAIPLRARSVGEILDLAFQLYRAHWLQMAIATGLILMPLAVVEMFATGDALRVVNFLWGLFLLAASSAVVALTSQLYLGEPITGVEAVGRVLRRFRSVWGASFIAGALTMIGLVLLVIPGLYAMAVCAVMQPAVMIEGCRSNDAYTRSRELTRGMRWPALATSAVATLITYMGVLGIGIVLDYLGLYGPAGMLIQSLAVIAVNPLGATVSTVLYYDLRIRKEAFDVERMADELAAPALAI